MSNAACTSPPNAWFNSTILSSMICANSPGEGGTFWVAKRRKMFVLQKKVGSFCAPKKFTLVHDQVMKLFLKNLFKKLCFCYSKTKLCYRQGHLPGGQRRSSHYPGGHWLLLWVNRGHLLHHHRRSWRLPKWQLSRYCSIRGQLLHHHHGSGSSPSPSSPL